jgi:hypothetical protein
MIILAAVGAYPCVDRRRYTLNHDVASLRNKAKLCTS